MRFGAFDHIGVWRRFLKQEVVIGNNKVVIPCGKELDGIRDSSGYTKIYKY